MKKLFFISFLLILLGTTASAALARNTMPEDAILAVVNDDVITYRDLSEYLKSRYVQLQADGVPEDEIKKTMAELETNGINRLIQDKLIISAANKKGIMIRKEVIDERVLALKDRYPSEETFMTMLLQDGMTLSDLRKRIEDQMKVQELVESEIKSKIIVNPQEITEYYDKNVSQYKKPERINLDSIFVAKGDNATLSREKTQQALDLIKSGKDFREVAQEYSQTPALGAMTKGQLLTPIENAAWERDVNQISDIIEVDNGYYILKVIGKIPAQTIPIEEVKTYIQNALTQKKFLTKMQDWIAQLEKDAFIEIKTELEPEPKTP